MSNKKSTSSYTEEELVEMLNILQDEQTAKANAKYNFERFVGKQIKSLNEIKTKVKVDSNLWPGLNRSVRIINSFTKEETEYDDISAVVEALPNTIIKNISAFGLFSINIWID